MKSIKNADTPAKPEKAAEPKTPSVAVFFKCVFPSEIESVFVFLI